MLVETSRSHVGFMLDDVSIEFGQPWHVFLVNLPTSRAILFSIFHKPQVGVVYYWLYHVKFWRLYRGVTLRYGQNLWSKLGEPSHQYVYVYIYIFVGEFVLPR